MPWLNGPAWIPALVRKAASNARVSFRMVRTSTGVSVPEVPDTSVSQPRPPGAHALREGFLPHKEMCPPVRSLQGKSRKKAAVASERDGAADTAARVRCYRRHPGRLVR